VKGSTARTRLSGRLGHSRSAWNCQLSKTARGRACSAFTVVFGRSAATGAVITVALLSAEFGPSLGWLRSRIIH
jgi:hypothetical protein